MSTSGDALWDTLQADPSDLSTFLALKALLDESGDAPSLIRAYELRAESIGGLEGLLLELTIAEVLAPATGDPDLAASAFDRLQRRLERGDPLRELMNDLAWKRGHWELLERFLTDDAHRADPGEERSGAFLELARFRLFKLDRATAAAESYRLAFRESAEALATCRSELETLDQSHPGNDEVQKALEEIYRQQSDFSSLHDLLAHRLEALSADESVERFGVLMAIARVAGRDLGRWDEAVDHLRRAANEREEWRSKVLETASELRRIYGDEPTLVAFVEELYQSAGDFEGSLNMLLARLNEHPSDGERAHIHANAAEILWNELDRREDALEQYESSLSYSGKYAEVAVKRYREMAKDAQDDASRAKLETRLEELLVYLQDHQALLSLWRDQLERASSPERRVDLLCTIGDLWQGPLGRPEAAVEHYHNAASAVRDSEQLQSVLDRLFFVVESGFGTDETTSILARLAEETGRWDDVLRLLSLRLERSPDSSEQASLNFQIGELLSDKLGQRKAAITHFVRAAEIDPEELVYTRRAREELRAGGHFAEAMTQLRTEIASCRDPVERAGLVCEAADLLQHDLNDPVGSFHLVIEQEQLGAATEPLLERARANLNAPRGYDHLRDALDSIPEGTEAQPNLDAAAVFLSRIALPSAGAAVDDAGLEVLLALHSRTALDSSSVSTLERGLKTRGRLSDLAEVLERRVSHAHDADEERQALTALLELAKSQSDQSDRAVEIYWRLATQQPLDWQIVDSFAELLEGLERLDELARLYDAVLTKVDSEAEPLRSKQLLARYATLQDAGLNRPDLASKTYRRLLWLDPLSSEAVAFFYRELGEKQDAPTLYQVLSGTLEQISDPAALADRHVKLASLAMEGLGDSGLALTHWDSGLKEPRVNPAATRQAIADLRAVSDKVDGPEYELRAIQGELALCDEPDEKVALLPRLVDLLEWTGRSVEAIEAVRELLAFKPGDMELLERAADTALQADDARAEADFVRRMLDAAPDRDDIRLRLARILADELHEPNEALTLMLEILERSPADSIVLDATEQLLTQQERYVDLIELLERQAERATSSEDRNRVLGRLADMAQMAPDQERDWRAWALAEILEQDPGRIDVAAQLARHFEDKNDWRQAVEVMQRLADHTTEVAPRAALLRRIGSILEHDVDDVEAATRAFNALAELVPDDEGAVRALIRLADKAKDDSLLPGLVFGLMELGPKEPISSELVHRATDIAEESAAEHPTAAAILAKWVELEPLDRASIERAIKLCEATEDWEGLARALDGLAGLAENDQSRIELWVKRGRILDERVGDLDAAAQCYRDVLRIHGANRMALNALKRIYTVQESWPQMLAVLERLARLDADPQVRAATLREAAEVHEKHLGIPEEAMALHRLAHELIVDETASLEQMARLASEHDLWEPYIEVLRRDIDRANTPEDHRRRLFNCASILEEQLGRAEDAFELLWNRFDSVPREDDIFSRLVDLSVHHELWDGLERVYRRLIRTRLETADQVALFRRLAELLTSKAEDPHRALAVLKEAQKIRPTDKETLAHMEQLSAAHDLWTDLDAFYQERWQETSQVRQKVELLRQRASLLETKLERWQDAFDQVVMAFQLEPDNRAIEAELYRYADDYEQWDTVIKLFEILIKERTEPALLCHLLEKLAELSTEKLGHPERAFDYIARGWRIDPSNERMRQRLAESARQADRLPHLADAYEWEAQNRADPADRIAAQIRLAELSVELLDLSRAVMAYTEAYKLNPGRAETLNGICQLLLNVGQGENLVRLLTRWVPYAERAEHRVSLFRTMAQVAEQLSLRDEAIEAYGGVLGVNPTDLDALSGLARLHRLSGAWDRVVRCLEQAQLIAKEPQRRFDIYHELADAFSRLNHNRQAIETLERSIDEFPERPWPTEQLVELYLLCDDTDAAIRYLERVGDRPNVEEATSALFLAAEIAVAKLNDTRRAVRLCNRVTRLDPTSQRAWSFLSDLAGWHERWQDQVDAYLHLADMPAQPLSDSEAPDIDSDKAIALSELLGETDLPGTGRLASLSAPSERALFLALAAVTLDRRLFYRDKAVELWQTLADESGDWPLPHFELARLADQVGDPDGGEAAYRRALSALERLGPFDELSLAWERLGARIEENPDRLTDSISAYEAAIAADASNLSAYERYERSLQKSGNLPKAKEFFDQLIASNLDESQRRAALVAYARCLEALEQPEAAADALQRAHGLGREDPTVQLALANLAFEQHDYSRATDIYASLLEQVHLGPQADLSSWEASGRDPSFALTLHKRLAAAAELGGKLDLAQEQYVEAHSLDPTDGEALTGLARLALTRGASALAEHYLESAMEVLDPASPQLGKALLVRASVTAARGNLSTAVAIFEGLAERDDDTAHTALERLADIHAQRSEWQEAVACLKRLETLLKPGDKQKELLLRRAEIARDRLEDSQQAWEAHAKALKLDPLSLSLRQHALESAVAVGLWQEAQSLANAVLPELSEPMDVAHCRLLAGAAASGLGDIGGARQHFSVAVRLDPYNTRAIEGLIEAASRQQDWTRLRQELSSALDRVGDTRPAVRGLILRALADVLAGPLRNVRGALKLYDELAVLYPEDVSLHQKHLDLALSTSPPDGPRAATTIKRMAGLGVLDIDGLRFLQRWYDQQDRPDGSLVMTALLALCDEVSPEERKELTRARADIDPVAAIDRLSVSTLSRTVRFEPAPQLVIDSLSAAAKAVASHEEEPPGPSHHMEAEFRRVCAILGCDKARLIWGQIGFGTSVVNAQICTVMTDPNDFNGLTDAEQRFEIASLAFLCQPEAIMTSILTEFDYVTFHEAALRPLRRQDPTNGDDSLQAAIEGWWATFGWTPASFPVTTSEETALDRDQIPTPIAWRQNETQTGWRIGLLYCDRIEAALAQLVRRHPALSGRPIRSIEDVQEAMKASDDIRHLISYALSEAYLNARDALGIAAVYFDTNAAPASDDEQDALAKKGVTEFELEIEEGTVGIGRPTEGGDEE